MELDERIIDGKKPLTAFDVMESKFIGTDCYFSDKPSDFADLSNCQVGKLMSLDAVSGMFGASKNNSYAVFNYCLPCEWVKKEEPKTKYRPFSLNEFLERYKMGNTVTFRLKKGEYVPEAESLVEYQRMITGYEGLPEDRDKPGKGSILLGGCPPVSLARLFEFYELDNDFNWQPFGILEE